jgi:hypothetical protein
MRHLWQAAARPREGVSLSVHGGQPEVGQAGGGRSLPFPGTPRPHVAQRRQARACTQCPTQIIKRNSLYLYKKAEGDILPITVSFCTPTILYLMSPYAISGNTLDFLLKLEKINILNVFLFGPTRLKGGRTVHYRKFRPKENASNHGSSQ